MDERVNNVQAIFGRHLTKGYLFFLNFDSRAFAAHIKAVRFLDAYRSVQAPTLDLVFQRLKDGVSALFLAGLIRTDENLCLFGHRRIPSHQRKVINLLNKGCISY